MTKVRVENKGSNPFRTTKIKKQKFMRTIILFLVLTLAAITSKAQNSDDYLIYDAVAYNIVDGDTFDAKAYVGFSITINKRFRVLGIDTWEIRTTNLEEKRKGYLAKARAEELLLNKIVTLWIPKASESGSFGRHLAFIKLADGTDYHILMYNEGHGVLQD